MAEHGDDSERLRLGGPELNAAGVPPIGLSDLLTALRAQFMNGAPPTAENANRAGQRAEIAAQDRMTQTSQPIPPGGVSEPSIDDIVASVAASSAPQDAPAPLPRPGDVVGIPGASTGGIEPGATGGSSVDPITLLPLLGRMIAGVEGQAGGREQQRALLTEPGNVPAIEGGGPAALRIGGPGDVGAIAGPPQDTTPRIGAPDVLPQISGPDSISQISGPSQPLALPPPTPELPGSGPTFDDLRAIVPLDASGNPDVRQLRQILGEEGLGFVMDSSAFESLTGEQKLAIISAIDAGVPERAGLNIGIGKALKAAF